jgi:general secretion pathway protein D
MIKKNTILALLIAYGLFLTSFAQAAVQSEAKTEPAAASAVEQKAEPAQAPTTPVVQPEAKAESAQPAATSVVQPAEQKTEPAQPPAAQPEVKIEPTASATPVVEQKAEPAQSSAAPVVQPEAKAESVTSAVSVVEQKTEPEQPVVPVVEQKTEHAKPRQELDDALTKRELAQLDQELESEIEFNFNNASLQNIVDQVSRLFNLTFIPDDIVKVPDATIKALSESKISFTTHSLLTKKKAWSLFTTFLELAGWALVSTPDSHTYRITNIDQANHSPLPTYINTSLDIVPKTDQRIRYVCFLENSTPDLMQPVLEKLKSPKAQIDKFALLRAIIITDAAYNVYSLLQIIRELDKTSSSQILSVITLREADAADVDALIKTLQSKDDTSSAPWMPKKESSVFYFSKDVSVIASPRTNSLILVGPKEGVKRIEQFILSHVDTTLTQRYEPVHVYDLNYAPAKQIADILNNVVSFGKGGGGGGGEQKAASAGEVGGVLGGLKYFGNVYIEPEEQNNRLIIRSSEEDYQHLKQIIDNLDKRQMQVAIEVMILEIRFDRIRELGIQWDTKKNRTLNAQLSGFWGQGVQVTPTGTPSPNSNSIIANLISLAKVAEAGTTVLTLGKQSIYAIMGILESDDQVRIIANPFIVATNKYRASVAIAEQRRAQTQIVGTGAGAGQGIGTFDAKWRVSITPQINEDAIVNLDIDVLLEDFSSPNSGTAATNANKTTTQVQTNTNVANKEVIALGGLIKKKKTVGETRFPVLSRIPLIGNLFKNSKHENDQSTLIILMSPTIIYPSDDFINTYTKNKAEETGVTAEYAAERHERTRRDPIYHWFFKAVDDNEKQYIDNFVNQTSSPQKTIKPESANAILKSVSEEGHD